MIQKINPVITIVKNDQWQLLILGTTLLIFLLIVLYFSRYYYKKKFNVSQTTNPQTGNTETKQTYGALKQCTKGQCIVNIKSGLKRCPSNKNTVLYANIGTEACTQLSLCPPQVPYAVNSDGSVNLQGTCENSEIPCRCTSIETCARYVESKFSVVNGSIFSPYRSEKNFILDQVPYSTYDSYNNSIEIDTDNEFCKINSTYSDVLVGGCSFLNQTNDFLMKCSKEQFSSEISVSPYSLDPYYLSSVITESKQFCEIQPYLDSNWNNMTLCVNQNPCKTGNYTYNFDKYRDVSIFKNNKGIVNSRNFCQSYASNLDTYLTDLQYYTLSCIGGVKCNQLPNDVDATKFFAGENNELDISGINASYNVKFESDTLVPVFGDFLNNPLKDSIKSGDIAYFNNNYYIIRKTRYIEFFIIINSIEFYTITKDGYERLLDNPSSSTDIIYYPQFALNGFSYNTVSSSLTKSSKFFRTSNIESSSDSSMPGGNYNPSFSIMDKGTFYRAGLLQPTSYVFKEYTQEEAVQEDLNDPSSSFNASDYKIKETKFNTEYYNDISFYSPVWNNTYGRNECIRCSPLLVASVNMAQVGTNTNDPVSALDRLAGIKPTPDPSLNVTTYVYDAVTIQFSGQDFGHYRINYLQLANPEKKWCYESRAHVNSAEISTTTNINLQRPNKNIRVGDFVLSSGGEFNFDLVPIETMEDSLKNKKCRIYMGDIDNQKQVSNFSPFYDDVESYGTFYGLGVDNNTYQDFIKGEYIDSTFNGNTFDVTSVLIDFSIFSNGKGAMFFGNKYYAIFNYDSENPNPSNYIYKQLTIVPKVVVSGISPNYDVISTTNFKRTGVFSRVVLSDQSSLQFISLDRNLFLNNDMKDINKGLAGSGGTMEIEEITDSRITSIKVTTPGSGYSNVSPLVRLKSYDPYFY